MKTRKIILLTSIAVLAVIYAVQLAVSSRSPIKTFKLKEKPDAITITFSDKEIKLSMEGGLWYIGDEKIPADDKKILDLSDAVGTIKVLGTVSRFSSENELTRYGLNDGQTIKVTAFKGEKELRRITIGKDASSSSQTYIQLDASSDTLLASGSLRTTFDVEEDSLKLKVEQPTSSEPDLTTEENAQQETGAL